MTSRLIGTIITSIPVANYEAISENDHNAAIEVPGEADSGQEGVNDFCIHLRTHFTEWLVLRPEALR